MKCKPDRRTVLAGLGAVAATLGIDETGAEAQTMEGVADLILFNGRNGRFTLGKWPIVTRGLRKDFSEVQSNSRIAGWSYNRYSAPVLSGCCRRPTCDISVC